ncbi:putative multidrug efflux transporter, MFS family protein [Synechococcus sp. WH 7805]|uniref:MFS transporter n=1 Tax=Synechococcus sp. (strain WH7805) TaxID=59931 RepID=UPI00006BD756|nr:MFS transporter [Synechococcus sp. WH 7805]EAR18376.1 putative multidrug efflux transporter, MFS family protein [Synechococcus sp. WH 7805]
MSGSSLNNPEPTLPTGGNPKGPRGLQTVVRLDGFRQLWIGQIFSQLADKFYIVLMVYLIAQYWVTSTPQENGALAEIATAIRMDFETRAQRITLLATGVYVANTIPAMVLGSVAGVWVDRWPKRRVMVASNGLRALLVLFTPLFLLPGPHWLGLSWGYWALLVMTFLESVLTQFFAPAEQAAIPLLVPKEHLLAANSLYQATSMGATIVGFALGDPILRGLNSLFQLVGLRGGEFLLLPFCYGMAALCLSTIRLHEQPRFEAVDSVWKEIVAGVQVLRERPSVRAALVHLVLLYSLLAALYVLAISLASAIQGLGPTGFGTLLAMSGLGMAIGAVLVAQVGHGFSRRRLAAAGLGAITWSLVLLGQLRGNLGYTLGLCSLLGLGAALVAIPAQTTIQEDTPESQRGRVFGLQNNLINIALSLPLVLAGALVSSIGLLPVLWVLAGLAFIAAVIERPWERC